MRKIKMPKVGNDVKKAIAKNSPAILKALGIAGFIGTAVYVGKATPKAMMLLEEKKLDLETEELTKVEIVKTVAPCYIPAVILAGLSIACILGSDSINARRNAALATAYALSESTLKEYRDKVVETIGEKKERDVRDRIAEDKVKKIPVVPEKVIDTENGDYLCLEPLSGRYFRSDVDKVRRALNNANERLLKDEYLSLNEFYYELGLDETKIGDELGWHIQGGLIEIHFSTQLANGDEPCLVIDFMDAPTYEYSKWL